MKEKELKIDLSCHVVYSKKCRGIVLESIKKHYGKEAVDEVFEKIQHQYEWYLQEFNRKDLGGKKNFHNGKCGTYDCIMLCCYYVVCKDKTSFSEIEEMTKKLGGASSSKLGFINIDKPVFKKLMYKAFKGATKRCDKWKDYEMHLSPYEKDKPLHYTFTRCPFADFVHQFHLEEIAGALCNVDYALMDSLNIKLVRRHTCIESDLCDYTFYSPKDPYVKEHPLYVDEEGFIRNK